MVRASLLSLPVVVALVGSPAQAAAPPRPPVLSPNALEVARKQLREVGLSLPDAASCPAGSTFRYRIEERPRAILAACWGASDGDRPVGPLVQWETTNAGEPFLSSLFGLAARDRGDPESLWWVPNRRTEIRWWSNGHLKSDGKNEWYEDGKPATEMRCNASASRCVSIRWSQDSSKREETVWDAGDLVERIYAPRTNITDPLKGDCAYYTGVEAAPAAALAQRLSSGDDAAFAEAFEMLADRSRGPVGAAAMARVDTARGFLKLIRAFLAHHGARAIAAFVEREFGDGVGGCALRAMAAKGGKEPWEVLLDIAKVARPDEQVLLADFAAEHPWLAHFIARRRLPAFDLAKPDPLNPFLERFEAAWIGPRNSAAGLGHGCAGDDRAAVRLERMTRSADVSGLLRVLYGKEMPLRSPRARWAAAKKLADLGLVEGQVVFAGEYAQLPDERTGLFDARSIQAFLEGATGISKTRAEELLALNNQIAKGVADATRTAEAPFLASTRARQLPKVAPEVGALLGTNLVFLRDSDGGSLAEGAQAFLFFEPTGVAQLYLGTSRKALALRGKYRLAAGRLTLHLSDKGIERRGTVALDLSAAGKARVELPFHLFSGKPGSSTWALESLDVVDGLFMVADAVELGEGATHRAARQRAFDQAAVRLASQPAPPSSDADSRIVDVYWHPEKSGFVIHMAGGLQMFAMEPPDLGRPEVNARLGEFKR